MNAPHAPLSADDHFEMHRCVLAELRRAREQLDEARAEIAEAREIAENSLVRMEACADRVTHADALLEHVRGYTRVMLDLAARAESVIELFDAKSQERARLLKSEIARARQATEHIRASVGSE